MNIVFYRHSLLNRGGDKMVLAYANFLAERGHRVTIYVNQIETGFPISPDMRLEQISLRGKLGTLVDACFRKIEADVVIADIIVMAIVLFLRNPKQVIYFAQDFNVSYYRDRLMRKFICKLYEVGLKYLRLPCLAVSEPLKKELAVFSDEVIAVPNGIVQEIFRRKEDVPPGYFKKERRAVTILGRCDFRKGWDIVQKVLDTMSSRQNTPEFELWVIGRDVPEGSGRFKIRTFDFVPDDELADILRTSDVFFYPTRHEGFGLFPLEAMACGCPVVTTPAVGFAKHGESAWVKDAEDVSGLCEGIERLLTDRTLRQTLIQNAEYLARQYDIKESCRKFEEALLKIKIMQGV